MKYNFEINGVPTPTMRLPVTDVAQQFTDAEFTRNGKSAVALLITCETNNVRLCIGGADPTQGAAGLGHILYVGQSLRITNPYAIRTLSYVNHTNGANAFIQVNFEFEIGA